MASVLWTVPIKVDPTAQATVVRLQAPAESLAP
jgi:hypothetical protein